MFQRQPSNCEKVRRPWTARRVLRVLAGIVGFVLGAGMVLLVRSRGGGGTDAMTLGYGLLLGAMFGAVGAAMVRDGDQAFPRPRPRTLDERVERIADEDALPERDEDARVR